MVQGTQITTDPDRSRKPVFHCFDYAYVINLDEDSTRLEKMSSRLASLGVPFDRFPAQRPSHRPPHSTDLQIMSGAYACAETHAALLRLILERGHENALILEDDVVFRDDTGDWMKQVASDLISHSWDLFYMGLHLIRAGGRVTRRLGRVKHGFHAHAYAVNKPAIPRLLACIEHMLANPVGPFDGYQAENLVKLYAIPILAIQEPNYSSTLGRYIDRLPQYFSVFDGDEFECHCNEMKTWQSQWRKILEFGHEFRHANKSYKGGYLEAAAHGYVKALAQWPELDVDLRKHPELSNMIRVLDEPHLANDEQLLKACTSLLSFVEQVWPF